jgi:anti-sigma regulatory factor (Ser/Thr protein kinase)
MYKFGLTLIGKEPAMAAGAKLQTPARVSVPHERSSVRVVRHAFADQLTAVGVPPEDREDAMLVLSELVSNAVKHAAALPDGQISVSWQVEDDELRLEVTDGGAGTRPNAGVAVMSAMGGRGLDIVRTVSSHWGVTESDGMVTVWAEVPRDRVDIEGRAQNQDSASH